ncbi:STAS domain-containing protein [Nonomuraea sp. NPDC050536]|uniref:STAS domain-containing protein n=1 Tax=Nonomuraea sp. NPDC050536 TaxID=3364366 RepID=UPI0037CA0576
MQAMRGLDHALAGSEGGRDAMTALTVTSSQLSSSTLIRVKGEVDTTTSEQLKAVITHGRRAGRPLVVDVSGMSFLDCKGLSVLLHAHTDAERDGGSLYLAGVQSRPLRVMQITAVLSRLNVYPTLDEAFTAISNGSPQPRTHRHAFGY